MKEWIYLFLGVVMLYGGGEFLVRGATRLALLLRLSPVFIGLTVVAFGTSAPELAATLVASFKGAGAVAFGNVVGSNIANLGLVLGLVALLSPVRASSQFVSQEMPFMILTGAVLFLTARDGSLGRLEGVLFVAFLGAFLLYLVKRDQGVELEEEAPAGSPGSVLLNLFLTALGIVLLSVGAEVLVEGAVGLARRFGVSERVIGLTLVAVGTSLPELVSTLVAAYRRAAGLVMGNIIGSNIMNVLAILGITSAVHPFSFSREGVVLDLGFMMAFFLLSWLMLLHRRTLGRLKGAVLFTLYVAYVLYLYGLHPVG